MQREKMHGQRRCHTAWCQSRVVTWRNCVSQRPIKSQPVKLASYKTYQIQMQAMSQNVGRRMSTSSASDNVQSFCSCVFATPQTHTYTVKPIFLSFSPRGSAAKTHRAATPFLVRKARV